MDVGLLDQRIKVYAPSHTLTDGVPVTTYTLANTWWGRIEPPTGREVTLGQQEGHVVNAVLTLDYGLAVGNHDLIRGEDGLLYEVRVQLPRRMGHTAVILLQRSDQAQATYTVAES